MFYGLYLIVNLVQFQYFKLYYRCNYNRKDAITSIKSHNNYNYKYHDQIILHYQHRILFFVSVLLVDRLKDEISSSSSSFFINNVPHTAFLSFQKDLVSYKSFKFNEKMDKNKRNILQSIILYVT